ncbi:16S rRNA (guanine(527)-N(7))-methyltransferase RsmG [Paenibacillus beijingensis]|uniref:Ribosomal RNA small subunit methyltransferase G n=1 Tax=Paenibacillus beijingensis TaxID=1126833 RepID=A0A0D5NIS1_9BACL|nr:16S rRNA (guanine(527)-N(7))-methyltransferase RsmG [Paenibacillus beijingensis]AJY74887.1 16S rRNA methyltransferase [Paenibacillus beijingensis]
MTALDDTVQQFQQLMTGRRLPLSPHQLEQFETYYRELVEWNEKMNLTGITEKAAVYEKHFFDSVSLSFFLDIASITRIADIGSGAGFPSLPLKICFPHLQVTIVDSLNKRIQFLKHLTDALGLTDVECIHGRAEDVARMPAHRDAYPLVTARAVARLQGLNELCLPFVQKDGWFAAMKGADTAEEVEEAAFSLRELKAKVERVESFQLPYEQSERAIVLIRKTGPTPKTYPRKAGIPLKQPLMGSKLGR